MICERVDKRFEKKDSARLGFVRNVYIYLTVIFLFQFVLFSGFASAAVCANPGKDGVGTPTGVVNTYYPGTASVSAGATSIPVGSSSGSATPIAAGDLLLIIQMQDADISYSNDSNYGSGSGTGSGYTNLNQTGYYEYAIAAGAVSGGFVSITGGLTYSYRYRAASATNGQSTYQVIRVPQYTSATVSSTVSALNWNGSVGGIVAIDVAGTLTLSGTITADGAGFRGGFGRTLAGGAGANTDYRTSYLVAANGSKGEGIAGSPYYMNRPATFNGAPVVATTYGSGYPDGTTTNASYARGAAGNAGGGGTDGNPAANDQNSGGGGGGNYAAGAKGGNSWNSNLTVGGEGGSAVSGIAFNRVVMGGGGGAGTTNNGTADSATYTSPAGLACTAGAGACSSGAPGGGIIILRANYVTGGGTITANGGSGYNVLNDSGGGGGAGGTVIIYTYAGGSITAYVNGGDGGNAWRSQDGTTYPGNRHGPGGGGSGGFIAYSPATLGISMSYTAGVSGKTTTANDLYGSSSSSGGYATFNSPDPPGVLPGAECVPDLSTSTKTVVDLNGGSYMAGDVLQYTITITETKGIAASGVSVTDAIDANLTSFTVVSYPAGATNSSTGTALNITGISVPASGSVTIVYTAIISGSATPGTTITNTATITTPKGTGATPAAPVVTVAGDVPGTGTKQLYLYDSTSTPAWKLSRTPNTTTAGFATITTTTSQTWIMDPAAAANITINAAVPVILYLRRNATTGTRSVQVNLQCSPGGTTLTQTQNLTLTTTPTAYTFTLPNAASVTCGQGYTWNLNVSETSGSTTYVYPAYGGNSSHVNLPATTVINVNSIGFYNAAYSGGSAITSVAPGATVYIRAVVSDPFGSYDIVNAPAITIKDPSNNTLVNAAAMTLVATGTESPSLTKTYQYQYTVPASPTGNWSVSVKATEGTEGTVTNTAYTTMPVAIPPVLTVVKSASPGPSVNPGQVVTYTVIVTNTGAGTATNVVATDFVPTYTTYVANSTRLNSITVAGDGSTLPLIAGLLVDDNGSRGAGVAATGILPAGKSATITFQVTVK